MNPFFAGITRIACAFSAFLGAISLRQFRPGPTFYQRLPLKPLIKKIACVLSTCICINTYAQSNYALNFDGTNDYVSTSAYVVPTSGDFTVEFWLYASNYSGYQEFV